MITGAVIFSLIFVWMVLRSNDTAQRLQDELPYDVAAILEPSKEVKKGPENSSQDGLGKANAVQPLPPAPIEGLFEMFEGKQLPISRIQDDMTPFQAYKRPFQPVAGRPIVSIVIVDYGVSELMSKSILDNMPPEISLVLSSYADEPSKWATAARTYGHEFWLGLPLQTKDFGVDDIGPRALLQNASAEENQRRLFNVLGTSVGYAGIVTQKDHIFDASSSGIEPALKQIFGRGLAMAESNTDTAALGLSMAMEFGYPYAQNNFWLDKDLRPSVVERTLREVEAQAMRKGKAIAFVHPYPAALNKVQEWLATAPENGIQIAPLSAMVQ
ncbi:MAG: hypothetical protein DI551_09375 [Micavibrio aeruginosavorus]|uniref:Divergent polysaccharide deacetylase family protein n=1 Tax=Micavibrio aeruginosavorus TaxID=349221 RepID=A0A2W5MU45_9BACT|nr:MAG: hypothetical protein DI551_09375 [Micavibrio aeruginosavorus]